MDHGKSSALGFLFWHDSNQRSAARILFFRDKLQFFESVHDGTQSSLRCVPRNFRGARTWLYAIDGGLLIFATDFLAIGASASRFLSHKKTLGPCPLNIRREWVWIWKVFASGPIWSAITLSDASCYGVDWSISLFSSLWSGGIFSRPKANRVWLYAGPEPYSRPSL